MAHLKNKALFFTTSPRTPSKMIPELRLLIEQFNGQPWNKQTQIDFTDSLSQSQFFEGKGSGKDKAFSARDRINRAPKALGFVDLKPYIALTEAGEEFIFGRRPQEIFLRQLLKFQLPSPYHVETKDIAGTFYIRPYLEILRLIRELGFISFDELKIFAVRLTDYRLLEWIKTKILHFRNEKQKAMVAYKRFIDSLWTNEIIDIYTKDIADGKLKTRESADTDLQDFIRTKKNNFRDYADACFRYLRYTGLVAISQRNYSMSIFEHKIAEVDYILSNIQRDPIFTSEEARYKKYLFDKKTPCLYVDNKDNIIEAVMRTGEYSRRDLSTQTIEELKDIRDEIIQRRRDAIIDAQTNEFKVKSYSHYMDIIDLFNEIFANECYDAPLMLEYNTWRAMTMIDGGLIRGNFTRDDEGQPLSTAVGNMPDIECYYPTFNLSVEVTMQNGQRQFETEGESVARHFGQFRKKYGKETYCLFIARRINPATFAHFFALNRFNVAYYGGKSKIVPMDLCQFMTLIEKSYSYRTKPEPEDVKKFFDSVIEYCHQAIDEQDWKDHIQLCVENWLQ